MHFKCVFCKQDLPYTNGNLYVCQCAGYLEYEREESIRFKQFNKERERALKYRKPKRRSRSCGSQSNENNE